MVLNCGSSSIKFALFETARAPLPMTPAWSGKVERIGTPQATYSATGEKPSALAGQTYHDALAHIRQQTQARLAGVPVKAIAHRVVHGGSKYSHPVRMDAAVLADLRGYIPLAPLHQPFALEAIEALLETQPELPQVACFDTAFHHTLPRVEQLLPLPHGAWERGLRRYGFHGLSYDYMSVALPLRHGDAARGRLIVAHLGSGASLCAMRDLQSVATTMGFSALDGLMMGTRPGALDPGAVIYLMEIEKLTLEEVGHLLYHESGLKGVSGLSDDSRVLEQAARGTDEQARHARDALDLYVRRIMREIGALTAVLGGLDMLVFTAGVGEHSAFIRARVCRELAYLGVAIDEAANAKNAPLISTAGCAVKVGVEPTNEEWVAARRALELLES
jgi:acetate kinase